MTSQRLKFRPSHSIARITTMVKTRHCPCQASRCSRIMLLLTQSPSARFGTYRSQAASSSKISEPATMGIWQMFFHRFSTNLASRSNVISTVQFRAFNFTTLDSADAAPFGTISDALNQLNYTMSRTCPQCEGRIVSSLDTNARNKKSRQPKPNEQLRKLRPGMWRDEKQAATRMPGSKEAPAQKQGSYAPDGSGHNSQQPATAAKLQLRNSGFPKAKL